LKLAGLSPVGVIGEMVNKDGTMMRMPQLEEVAERDDLKLITTEQIVARLEQSNIQRSDPNSDRVTFETEAIVPTTHGTFRMRGYNDNFTNADHVAIVSGFPSGHDVLVRIHSECITGEAFGSLKCECGPQLDYALDEIAASPEGGVVLYLRGQEGRGIGLINKFKAYALQQTGLDTVDANLALGLPSENREYGAAIAMLRDLGIESVRLMTNNPAKGDSLIAAGIPVTEYVPVIVGIAAQNAGYLETKRDRMGHMIPSEV
jgi:3,4-dihydroxy 2-butanone 4-phosphate synthase/GTP cyclohydrolase II